MVRTQVSLTCRSFHGAFMNLLVVQIRTLEAMNYHTVYEFVFYFSRRKAENQSVDSSPDLAVQDLIFDNKYGTRDFDLSSRSTSGTTHHAHNAWEK